MTGFRQSGSSGPKSGSNIKNPVNIRLRKSPK